MCSVGPVLLHVGTGIGHCAWEAGRVGRSAWVPLQSLERFMSPEDAACLMW